MSSAAVRLTVSFLRPLWRPLALGLCFRTRRDTPPPSPESDTLVLPGHLLPARGCQVLRRQEHRGKEHRPSRDLLLGLGGAEENRHSPDEHQEGSDPVC